MNIVFAFGVRFVAGRMLGCLLLFERGAGFWYRGRLGFVMVC